MRSIVLANQKGGVGKTTTAVHLAQGLALAGKRVALFDLDPQGNATVALQAAELQADEAVEGLLRVTSNLWLLASPGDSVTLSPNAELDIRGLQALADQLEQSVEWLIIDCPPRMDAWGWAGLRLAKQVIVPVQAEFFAMHGLSQMLGSLDLAAKQFSGKAQLLGVLPTMVDLREPVSLEILEDLRRNLGDRVLQTIILRDSHVVEAASFGQSVFQHSPFSKSAFCYAQLVKELVDG